MKILKLIFIFTLLGLVSCKSDDDTSGIDFPTTFTAQSFTEKVTKVYTADGEITDPEILEKFFANNAENLPSLTVETEVPEFTIEYLNETEGIVTQFFDSNIFEGVGEGLASRNVNIIKQDGITYLENNEATATRPFAPIPAGLGVDAATPIDPNVLIVEENPFYKFRPLSIEIGEAEFTTPIFDSGNGETSIVSILPALLTKESLYFKENGDNLELFQTDTFFKLTEQTLNSDEDSGGTDNIQLGNLNESTQTMTQINNCYNASYSDQLRNRTIYSYEDIDGNFKTTEDIDMIPSNAELLFTDITRDTLLVNEYKLIFRPN